MKIPAILYKRHSTDHQDSERQDYALPHYCELHNLSVAHTLADAAESSGKAIKNRKAGRELSAIVADYRARGEKFAFVAMEQDRVGCDVVDTVLIIREIWDAGGEIHFTEEGGLVNRDKDGMLIGIKAVLGEERLRQIQRKTKSKSIQLVAQNRLAGHIPFGHDAIYIFADGHRCRVTSRALRFSNAQKGIVGDTEANALTAAHGHVIEKRLVDNLAEQGWIRWMHARVTADKWSYCAVAKALRARGVTAKMGNPMGVSSVVTILRNQYSLKILATPEVLAA